MDSLLKFTNLHKSVLAVYKGFDKTIKNSHQPLNFDPRPLSTDYLLFLVATEHVFIFLLGCVWILLNVLY